MSTYNGVINIKNGETWDTFLPATLAVNVLVDSTHNVAQKISEIESSIETETNNRISSYNLLNSKIENINKIFFNVKDFGATGDGITDDTNSIKTAIQNAYGNVLFFPEGDYIVSDTLNLAETITISGANKATTKIFTNFTTKDLFIVNGSGTTISDLTLESKVTKTAGVAINHNSSTILLTIRDCIITNQATAVNMSGTLDRIEDCYIYNFSLRGLQIIGGNDQFISKVVIDSPNIKPICGIYLYNTSAVFISDSDIIRSSTDLMIDSSIGAGITCVYIANSFFDTADTGMDFIGTGPITRIKAVNSWFCGHTGSGISFNNNKLDGLDIVSCHIQNNGVNGMSIFKGKNIIVNSCQISGNTSTGISTAGGIGNLILTNNIVGLTCDYPGNGNGIYLDSGAYQNLIVTGNIVQGNTSSQLTDSTTSTVGKVIANNL